MTPKNANSAGSCCQQMLSTAVPPVLTAAGKSAGRLRSPIPLANMARNLAQADEFISQIQRPIVCPCWLTTAGQVFEHGSGDFLGRVLHGDVFPGHFNEVTGE